MRRAAAVVALSIALAGCGAARRAAQPAPTPPAATAGPAATAVSSTNRLALALLGRVGGTGNLVFSPYGINRSLAMVDQGAAGETASQIDRLLGGSPAELASSHSDLARRLTASAGQLKSADAVWLQAALGLEQRFKRTLAGDFGAAPRTVDFQADPAAAAGTINAWAAAATGNLIRDVMPPAAIDRLTRLVLADAVYLKARWRYPFQHSLTRPRSFFTPSGRAVTAQFMSRRPVLLRYGACSAYRAVELPYRNSSLSMLLVMPSSDTLSHLQRRLNVAAIEGSLQPRLLVVTMPRLDLFTRAQLNGVLAAMGMPLAFSRRADFSGITKQVSLRIHAVEHGAELRADEAGTVAAAATAISIIPTLAVRPATRLVLDHPFLAFIRDRDTGAILFAARVADPSRKS